MTYTFVIVVAFAVGTSAGKTPVVEHDFDRSEELFLSQNIDFEAYRRLPLDLNSELHKPLHFDGVKGSEGGCFDPKTGYFSAPVSGLYVFNFTTPMNDRAKLMKDNYEVIMLSKIGNGRPEKSKTKRNIFLQLDKNDKVWLRPGHGKHLHDNDTDSFTTFSGRLLTTDLNLGSSKGRLHKRSTGQRSSESLQRYFRDVHYTPVSLVERNIHSVPTIETSEEHVVFTKQRVAFSVTCTKSMIGGHMTDTTESLNGEMSPHATPNGRIGFDKVLVNFGGGFDVEGAEFVAPTNGVYYFSFNVGKFPRKKLSVMLMKNFNEVQSIIYNDSKTRAREIQGQSLMLQLKKGDQIWLRSFNNKDYAVYSNLGNYITFSGYLVYAL